MYPQQSADRTAYATKDDIEAGRVTGVGYAIPVESGIPIAVYVNDTPARPAPLPVVQQVAPQQPTVIVQRAGLDPVTTRIAAASAGAVGVAAAVGHYAHQLAEFAHAAEGAGIAIGVAAAGIALWKGSAPKIAVNVTANITGATAHGGNANARSASGWKSSTS